MLIFADIFAAGYYRRHAQWKHIIRLMPWTLLGIIAGYFAMGKVSDTQLKPIIGAIVLAMLILKFIQDRRKTLDDSKTISLTAQWAFVVMLGFFAGLTTMMANAAGPIMIIYLLSTGLAKTEFVGTGAWFFFIVNWVKVPFNIKLSLITPDSLKLDATLFPLIVIGAVAGILILKHIPQKLFRIVVMILAAAAAIKLLFF
jgi:uncharacterized membrane protein YfcA